MRGEPYRRCGSCGMVGVASRALRNDTRSLLMRAVAGEDVVITVDGRPGAALGPVGSRPQWM
jgi:prevent-host-death family protein